MLTKALACPTWRSTLRSLAMFCLLTLCTARVGLAQGRVFTATQAGNPEAGGIGARIMRGNGSSLSARTTVTILPFLNVIGALDLHWNQRSVQGADQGKGRIEAAALTVQHNTPVEVRLSAFADPPAGQGSGPMVISSYFENTGRYGNHERHIPILWFAALPAQAVNGRQMSISPNDSGGQFGILLERQFIAQPGDGRQQTGSPVQTTGRGRVTITPLW